jgi:membrane-associated phospholipid phosphatase
VQKILKLAVLASLPLYAQTAAQIEPTAGAWKTWIIPSGKEFRVAAPPDAAETRRELEWLKSLEGTRKDPKIAQQITFWDAGSPAYRWMDLISKRILNGQAGSAYPHRIQAYVAMAMYDATIATWDSKYTYNRPRPSDVDPTLRTAVTTPRSPSYPSEYAATAGAAAAVLSYFLPQEAESFQWLAEEAGKSRLYAGTEFPSDYTAGINLGRRVAALVIDRARADGSDAVWTGSVPTGKCKWIGANPLFIAAANWKPILLTSPEEYRPAAPPACDSPEVTQQSAAVSAFPRTFVTNQKAYYWQGPEGLQTWPLVYADKWMHEDRIDQNPPRAARVYALIGASYFDAFIASQDGKFAYWYIRPHQLDQAMNPLFPVPNFPSYPSNHSTFSATRAEILAYLFPGRADFIRAVGKEAGDSRIWAGLHFEMDNEAGVQLGRAVAAKFIAWASLDSSQQ